MAEKRLLKELKQLSKTPASEANHQILSLYPEDPESSLFSWRAVIAKPFKTDSPYYYNGKWELLISVGQHYPNRPPSISFSRHTPINHPNINIETGEICLDILKDDAWSPAWNLQHLVGAILMLLDDPEPDSPLNVDSSNLYRSDKKAFESMAQYTIWKHGTLYEGTKDNTGMKLPPSLFIGVSSDEEDDDDVSSQESDEVEADTEFQDSLQQPLASEQIKRKLEQHDQETCGNVLSSVEVLNISDKPMEPAVSPTRDLSDEYIHDLGRQVTREFLKKATEVESSSPEDLSKSPSSQSLAAVHQHVTNNVAKQIEEICSKGASNPQPPIDKIDKKAEKKPDIEKIKASFLRNIDQQVDEIRRNQEQQSVVQ